MKKRYIRLFILLIGIGLIVINHSDKQPSNSSKVEPKDEVVFKIYQSNEICEGVDRSINKIQDQPFPVKNASNLRFWKVELNTEEKVNFITEQEDPFKVGQKFFLATNCKELTKEELIKFNTLKKKQPDCLKVYRWDQKIQEIKTECGYVLDEKFVFLR